MKRELSTGRMARVVVVGARGAYIERLVEGLGAVHAPAGAPFPEDCREVVVYAAAAGVGRRGAPDLEAAVGVFARCAGTGVQHVVLVSSAAIHEPSHHQAGLVSEERRSVRRGGNAVAEGWRELESLARQRLRGSGTRLTILRPAAVAVRGGTDYFNRLLAGRVAFTLPGFDPSIQILDPRDLTAAVRRVVERSPEGIVPGEVYHVAPSAVTPLRAALRAAGTWRLPVPYSLQWLARKVLAPRGLAAPVEQLAYIRYPWTVSGEKIRRQLDHRPGRSSVAAVRARAGTEPRSEPELATDDFGMEKGYIARLGRTLFRFLHNAWWRVEWKGLEHVPRAGRAVLAGVHRGHQPWDGIMTLYLLVRELGRYPRFLIHPALVKFPFLAPYMTRCGGVLACRENAGRILERGGLVAIFPEGIRGAFSMYRDSYKLGRFGRDSYVKIALRHRAPIIPYVTVGSAEIFPILGRIDWRWWKRYSEWPFLPITPTMGTVPLPSKWHTSFLEPVEVDGYPPEAAEDREIVAALSQEVRRRMETAIAEMLRRRKSIFWGRIFDQGPPSTLEEHLA